MAFFNVYRDDLDGGDEGEFAYLQETQPEVQDAEMESDDEGGREVLTRTELLERVREVARQEGGEMEAELDVEDVSWVDGDESDGEQTKLKEISLRRGQEVKCLRDAFDMRLMSFPGA